MILNKYFTQRDLFFIALANVIAFGLYYITSDAHANVDKTWFDPPKYIFFIIWPILYSYMAYFLSKSFYDKKCMSLKISIILLFLFSYLWMIFFGRNDKRNAIFTFVPLINLSMMCENLIYHHYGYNFRLFSAWLIFALVLSSHQE